jgi:predicted AlkP superfamily pyrophosphatase or phosphodiesterase
MTPRAFATAVALLSCLASAAGAAPAPAAGRPKLVVFLSVDQMRADYLDQYGANWSKGLRTLFDKGAHFRAARYPYLGTVTCPGHTTMGTGAYPHRHGMILNTWWDRETRKVIECTDDPASPLVFYGDKHPSAGDSAKNMMVPTLADEMKAQLQPAPRTVSFSLKARSAIGLVGHKPDLVTWFEAGSWVTAKAFAAGPSPVVSKLVAANPIDPVLEKPWDRILPAIAYKFADDAPEERPGSSKWSRVFPHVLAIGPEAAAPVPVPVPGARYVLWQASPLTDEHLGKLARGALAEMKLGQGPGTDFLSVSFSALDAVGHPFGPRSQEVQDVLARLDRVIGELLEALDRSVGPGKYVLALSADHGVAVYPEQLKAEGKDAGRVSMTEVSTKLTSVLTAELGPGNGVANIQYTDIYLGPGVFERLRQKPGALARALAAVRAVPGVEAVYSTDELRGGGKSDDPIRRAAELSHFPGRSGDLVLAPRANWLTVSVGTTHGTQHEYDQHVPIVLYGAGITPGKYDRPVSPGDLAPTLARLVGVNLPTAEGAPLTEALAEAVASPPKTLPKKGKGKGDGKGAHKAAVR